MLYENYENDKSYRGRHHLIGGIMCYTTCITLEYASSEKLSSVKRTNHMSIQEVFLDHVLLLSDCAGWKTGC